MLQRKGTVSKSSGPVHVNSYALKGVPVRYTPPFFLPDQVTLPAGWTLPSVPSDDLFRYDYSREKAVLEQARMRTISLAAEAQARETREKAEEEKRRIEAAAAAERAKVTTSTAELPPPLIPSPGSAILTPTPAPKPTPTQTPPTRNIDGGVAGTQSGTGIHIKQSGDIIKPLGEMSLSEFEGDNFNPFDTASLQAINDMEVLQTISLAPPPVSDSSRAPNTNTGVQVSNGSGAVLTSPPGLSSTVPSSQSIFTSYMPPLPPASSTSVAPASSVSGPPFQQTAVPVSFPGPPLSQIGPTSQSAFHPVPPTSAVMSGSSQFATSPSPSVSQAHSVATTPPHPSLPTLPVLPPIGTNLTPSQSAPSHGSNHTSQPLHRDQQTVPPMNSSMAQSTPAFPLRPSTNNSPAISLSSSPLASSAGVQTQPMLTPYPSLAHPVTGSQSNPQPGNSPSVTGAHLSPHVPQQAAVSAASGGVGGVQRESGAPGAGGDVGTLVSVRTEADATAHAQQPAQKPPVPRPRSGNTGHHVPISAHLPYNSSSTPPPATVAATKPSPPTPNIQARANSLVASLPQGQSLLSRPGLGVAVLPLIPSPHQSPPSHSSFSTPPPYHQQFPGSGVHSSSPPPPYYPSPHDDTRRASEPVHLPSQQPLTTHTHFTLPDPQSLTQEEKTEVESISGMGFPAARVARAVRRYSGNRTQVVDFLILVGIVEESSGSKGDSAEVALTVCDNNETKAKRYLEKVRYYKESGFSEKRIHEAYEKAGKDWEKTLDILTQSTAS